MILWGSSEGTGGGGGVLHEHWHWLRRSNVPVALSAAVLLGLGGISVGVALLGEVTRQLRLALSTAVGNASVVTVSPLVRASHCGELVTVMTPNAVCSEMMH
jgi:hypothetical protein